MNDYKIVTAGGTMRFYGEWFGRPYDNYHKIFNAVFENDCLTIYFKNNEVLVIFNPKEIINEEHCFGVKQATKVIWQYTPYGSNSVIQYIYEYCSNGTILKTINGNEKRFSADESIAVQCLSY